MPHQKRDELLHYHRATSLPVLYLLQGLDHDPRFQVGAPQVAHPIREVVETLLRMVRESEAFVARVKAMLGEEDEVKTEEKEEDSLEAKQEEELEEQREQEDQEAPPPPKQEEQEDQVAPPPPKRRRESVAVAREVRRTARAGAPAIGARPAQAALSATSGSATAPLAEGGVQQKLARLPSVPVFAPQVVKAPASPQQSSRKSAAQQGMQITTVVKQEFATTTTNRPPQRLPAVGSSSQQTPNRPFQRLPATANTVVSIDH